MHFFTCNYFQKNTQTDLPHFSSLFFSTIISIHTLCLRLLWARPIHNLRSRVGPGEERAFWRSTTRRRWAKILIRKKRGEYVHGGEDETLNSLPPNRETTMVRPSHHYYYFQSSHLHPQQTTRLGTLTHSYLVPHCRFYHLTKPKSSTGFRLLHLGFPN